MVLALWLREGEYHSALVCGLLKRWERLATQRDAADGGVVGLVVVDLQPERFEQREVEVESLRDRLVAESLGNPPVVDLADDRGLDRLLDELALGPRTVPTLPSITRPSSPCLLGAALVGRVLVVGVLLVEPDLDGAVAVAGFADVVALIGVGLEPVASPLDHVQRVPLSDALLDPSGEHRGRVDEHVGIEPNGLIGGPQSDVG
ncbi:hypothetical protein [Amycolatopsis arida]|uniref:hypothetical protein n=1 Tax=Amycolatopsis arida TaxID=587909 RepID=UPI001FBA6C2C|nr:hypothetical protein [Amycolatopsis arida]